jgi:formylglycine-generating enzyme required for sulfatase activity
MRPTRIAVFSLVMLLPAVSWGQTTKPAPKELTLDLGNKVTMKLVLIPAGKFTMGSPKDEKGHQEDEAPQHEVMISKPFHMGIYHVTRGQFAAFVDDVKGGAKPWRGAGGAIS